MPRQWLSCRNTTVPDVNNMPCQLALCKGQPERSPCQLSKQSLVQHLSRPCFLEVLMAAQLKVSTGIQSFHEELLGTLISSIKQAKNPIVVGPNY